MVTLHRTLCGGLRRGAQSEFFLAFLGLKEAKTKTLKCKYLIHLCDSCLKAMKTEWKKKKTEEEHEEEEEEETSEEEQQHHQEEGDHTY